MADPPGSSTDTLAASTQSVLGIHSARNLEDSIGDAHRVWFVIFDQSNEEYVAMGYPRHAHLTWLLSNYQPSEILQSDDLNVYLFESRLLQEWMN
jgi:hypothetical protein